MTFDWRRDVPVWALLHFQGSDGYRLGCILTGWKGTPKGGKLTVYDPALQKTSTFQIYK